MKHIISMALLRVEVAVDVNDVATWYTAAKGYTGLDVRTQHA